MSIARANCRFEFLARRERQIGALRMVYPDAMPERLKNLAYLQRSSFAILNRRWLPLYRNHNERAARAQIFHEFFEGCWYPDMRRDAWR